MMKKFSTRANKWLYVFALILHIFKFFAKSKILFLYYIDDYQKDYLFSNSFIQLSNQSSNHFFFLFIHFYHLFFFFLFCFSFLFFQFFFSFFSSSFNSRRSFESRFSSFFVICSIFKKSEKFFSFSSSYSFSFFSSFFSECFASLNQLKTFIMCSRTQTFAITYKTKVCEFSKIIWFRLNLIRISAVERAQRDSFQDDSKYV